MPLDIVAFMPDTTSWTGAPASTARPAAGLAAADSPIASATRIRAKRRLAITVPPSAFDRAGENALREVPLEQWVHEQDRQRAQHDHRHLERLRGRRLAQERVELDVAERRALEHVLAQHELHRPH